MIVPWDADAWWTALRLKAPTRTFVNEKLPSPSVVATYARLSARVVIITPAFGTAAPLAFFTAPITVPRAFMKRSMPSCCP